MSEAGSTTVEAIAVIAREHHLGVAAAESLTSGQVAGALGSGPEAATWFRGAVVAYSPTVKFDLLGVPRGPVVTDECARTMARGAARVLDADAVVAATGVGGPEPEEDQPPGTVYIAARVLGAERCGRFEFDGEPPEVLEQTVSASLDLLRELLEDVVSAPPRPGTAHAAGPAG